MDVSAMAVEKEKENETCVSSMVDPFLIEALQNPRHRLTNTGTLAMDLLDDIFVEPSAVKAPARTKFQPKAKPQPKKGAKEQPTPFALANSDKVHLPNRSSTETTGTEQPLLSRCNLENVVEDGILSDKTVDVVVGSPGNSEIAFSKALGTSLESPGPKDTISQLKTAGDTSGFPDVAVASTSPFRTCNARNLFTPSTNQESEHSEEILFANDGDFQIDMEQETVDFSFLEEETSKKRRLQNSEKFSSENDTPSKKKIMEAMTPEEPTEKPRKKFRFPRATRRKQYAQEGETDLRTMPIRDVIMLAEYKERQAKKQAQAVLPSSTNERRSENTWQEDPPYGEYETYGSDEDTGSLDDPSTSRVIEDTGYFNYKSYSAKRNKRWSKHETELFYQGIQEFGPDFGMIQQRHFPERSRHQVKLKYKKEERQCPMRIHDSLTNRTKDLSHFEVLIKKLQEQEKSAREDDDEGRDEETHETSAISEETANSEENTLNQDRDSNVGVESPAKSYDNEDEFNWDEYKSEL